ncbi:hypothetical protein E1A91_A02G041600v1 [Gossypium mustelinum]|uniref:BHLH domain-containing protein n=1 Tax=Gossypium mustelinum TaxID=34275 RepID=A0A5D3A1A6_GOSMU|nr:hypothetical protein E1A91_A02G041600v1 [Gossypium mustelinum]
MDELIKLLLGEHGTIWYETTPVLQPVRPSAFQPYPKTPRTEPWLEADGCNNGVRSGNINKRLIEFLRKTNWVSVISKDEKKQRCLKHMMKERIRREKQKKCYFALYSMLPLGTKNDKNSIVQTATMTVRELEMEREELQRNNNELLVNLGGNASKIRARIDDPSYEIDYMLAVLKCLKTLDSKPGMIRTTVYNQELVLDLATKMKAADVENAINRTLQEVERKLEESRSI